MKFFVLFGSVWIPFCCDPLASFAIDLELMWQAAAVSEGEVELVLNRFNLSLVADGKMLV